jgi:hypothetical protein
LFSGQKRSGARMVEALDLILNGAKNAHPGAQKDRSKVRKRRRP